MQINLTAYQRRGTAFAHDLIMTGVAIFVCYTIRFEPSQMVIWQRHMWALMAVIIPIAALVYWRFGLYRGVWRFASLPDVANIMKAVATLTVAVVAVDYLSRQQIIVPRGVALAFPFLLFSSLCALRFAYRGYRNNRDARLRRKQKTGVPVLIHGTGTEAELLIRSLEASTTSPYVPIGMIATNGQHQGQVIRNVPVLGLDINFDKILKDQKVVEEKPKRLIITDEALRRSSNINVVMAQADAAGIICSKLERPIGDNDNATAKINLSPIEIEDLLGRTRRQIDYGAIRQLLKGKRVLVTGGGGSIGQELCKQAVSLDIDRLMVVDISEFNLYDVAKTLETDAPRAKVETRLCDIRDRDLLASIFEEFRPEIVFHAAALKHVPMLEDEVAQGVATNVFGTRNVAELAAQHNSEVAVMVSTDKAVKPTSVVGATKRLAEMICQSIDLKHRQNNKSDQRIVCVRFGNVLGSSGSVVPRFWEQIRRGGPVTITHPDMVRYFMTVREAVSLILRAAAHTTERSKDPIAVYALNMGEPQRIIDLAERMISLAGYVPGEDIALEITGMRPGEKLAEELYDSGEDLIATEVEGLLAAQANTVMDTVFEENLATLQASLKTASRSDIRRQLKTLVPQYAA